jgi:hypothetical protein
MQNDDFLNPDAQVAAPADEADALVLNLNDVDEEAGTYEAIPAGIYNCIVENTEFGPSSKGNPMISWTFKVIDPQYEGRFLFYHTVLNSEAGKGRLKKLLLRVAPDVDLGSLSPKKLCEEGVVLGLPCRVKTRIKPYQGEKRNDTQDVLAPLSDGEAGFLDE